MALEFLQGGEFFTYIAKVGKFSWKVASFYAAQIVLALEYLHSYKIAYRDLKPENLLISAEGYLKLTDFGFAKEVHDKTYTICGTPDYIAPETLMNRGHDCAVDWWALGVFIYEIIAGVTPFQADVPMDMYKKIL